MDRNAVRAASAQPCHMISLPPAALKSERSAFVAFRNLPVGRAALISLSRFDVRKLKLGSKTKYLRYPSANRNCSGGIAPLPVIHSGQPVAAPSSCPCGHPKLSGRPDELVGPLWM